ncbi:ABC transporter ATP-binding protein [Rhizobium tubonense]|uniref:ABC transporter ATP-binding protein n=1 Tax=Rhizobium tubonense TaxID=484088 RepID=A0A2W4E724_9HYPH|nr:ABC transporter ATP-binding protein [Rhizobium tubonense]PZM08163.1 ABC transporter ATP-binding protein [Rhizobium tubonense]
MTTLQLKNIVKRFKTQTVLDNLSLDVGDSERLVLFGPSGAGKTVLLRLIAGVVDPDEGSVLIGGEDMADVDAEYRGVGMAFQNFALFPHMTAFQNIASPLEAKRSSSRAIKEGVDKVARLLKIDHVLLHHPKALSNGQKQRTALARALAGSPPLLLLDDPLRNVDAKLRFEMRLELPRLLAAQGATVVYVTQDYKEAMALGDRIAVMSQGRIRQIGTPEEIYNTPADMEIARLFGDPVVNLLDVTPLASSGGIHVELSNVKVTLPDFSEEVVGRSCVLGLRPETVAFTNAATPGAIPVTVAAETPLNEKTVALVLTARGREILLSRPAGTPGPTSGDAHIAVNGRSAFLFDKESGLLIRPRAKIMSRSGEAA